MVRFFLILYFFHILLLSLGQANCDHDKLNITLGRHIMNYPIYAGYEVFSESGLEKLYSFIQANLAYPKTAIEDKIGGLVVSTFWIDSTAATYEHRISQGIRSDLDNEVMRLAKLIEFDAPATDYYGKPTCMFFTLPIRFTLENEKKTSAYGKKFKNKQKK